MIALVVSQYHQSLATLARSLYLSAYSLRVPLGGYYLLNIIAPTRIIIYFIHQHIPQTVLQLCMCEGRRCIFIVLFYFIVIVDISEILVNCTLFYCISILLRIYSHTYIHTYMYNIYSIDRISNTNS